jgi:hypothetical protein
MQSGQKLNARTAVLHNNAVQSKIKHRNRYVTK